MDYTTKDPTQQDATEWISRFWSHVDKRGPTECWNWTGYKLRGHGQLTIECKQYYAHRVSYEMRFGPIPDGLYVCHSCSNPSCVNPDHLYVGSQSDNLRDMVDAGRSCRGEQRSHKLTDTVITQIRQLWPLCNLGYDAFGARFGVSGGAIWAIVHHKSWKHLP